MYEIGQTVMYGTEGVCVIEEVRVMKVGREKAEYYVLRPVRRGGATVFVPVQNPLLTAKMRELVTAEEIHSLLDELRRQEPRWIDDPNERKEEFRRIMAAGNCRELLAMARTLCVRRDVLQGINKRLRTNDEQTLRDAERLLSDEFSRVLEIEPQEVGAYIRSRLENPA